MSTTDLPRDRHREPRGRASGLDVAALDAAVPRVGTARRMATVAAHQAKELTLAGLSRLPGIGPSVDRPRTQPLRSGAIAMNRWWRSAYGSAAKPARLGAIPWDYVEQRQDDIPFLGLREHWYPALPSRDLRHNAAVPVTLLGDGLVLFRTADGQAAALENRCPHRGPLLSLGQVGVLQAGTITCRYHGMTFDGDGECVAFLADGADSPACGKVRTRRYATEEVGGVIWVWMGDGAPAPLMSHVPRAHDVLDYTHKFIHTVQIPISHLNILDNAVDLTHTGVLHRTCLLFSGQKPSGRLAVTELDRPDGTPSGVHVEYRDDGPQAGQFSIDQIEWYLPNFVYHDHDDLGGGLGAGFFWFVPRDVGSFTGFFILGLKDAPNPFLDRLKRTFFEVMWSRWYPVPGTVSSCLDGGDLPMMASQGRVARWDADDLSRTDGGVVKARRMVQAAHRAEVADRRRRSERSGRPLPRLQRPLGPA